jgi:cytochrome c
MMKNPCSPKNVSNPCAVKPPLRKKGFKNQAKAIKAGKILWGDTKLGTSGLSCNSCHANGMQLNLDKVGPFPHYVAMPKDVVTLDQMINYCMVNPMKAEPLPWDSRELTAMAAYYQDIVKRYKEGALNPCAVNPCAAKNPCAANPCAIKNPCGMKNPCSGFLGAVPILPIPIFSSP